MNTTDRTMIVVGLLSIVIVLYQTKFTLKNHNNFSRYNDNATKDRIVEGKSIQYRPRRISSHPRTPMQIGEKRSFSTKPQCSFREYLVLKVFQEGDEDIPSYFYFYAVSNEAKGFRKLVGGNEKEKYQHQLAYISCTPGWISHLEVFVQSLGISYGQLGSDYPRGCGIGIVLTELCLIDPVISTMKVGKDYRGEQIGNKAMRALKQDIKGLVQDNCYKLVGLTMMAAADGTASTGHVYFSAAINMDYDHMIVDMTTGPNVQYRIYETKEAKRNYKSNGDIDACCGMDRCSAYSRTWIFCGNMNPIFSKLGQITLSTKL